MADFENKEKVERILSLFVSLNKADMAKALSLLVKEAERRNGGDNIMTTQL